MGSNQHPVDRMKISLILNNNNSNKVDEDDEESDTSSCDGGSIGSPRSNCSRASPRRRKPRPACKKYHREQAYFIWYHRIDLGKTWDEVNASFTQQFGEKRGKGGLQCKYYRVLGEENVAKVRDQGRWSRSHGAQRVGKDSNFGVIQRTNKRFSWMRREDQEKPMMPCFTPGGCRRHGCVICSTNVGQ